MMPKINDHGPPVEQSLEHFLEDPNAAASKATSPQQPANTGTKWSDHVNGLSESSLEKNRFLRIGIVACVKDTSTANHHHLRNRD